MQLHFAPAALRERGTWWVEAPGGVFLPPVVLGADGRLQPAAVEQVVVPLPR